MHRFREVFYCMKITLVIDQYDKGNNGTTMTARRFAGTLRSHGHQVSVLGADCHGDEILYSTGISRFPVLYQVALSQGMVFARVNKTIIREAVKDADIVHFLLPFRLGHAAKKICDDLAIPSTAAFHCQPENITSTIYLNNLGVVNDFIYRWFRKFYDRFTHVHCPSEMIAHQLELHGYNAQLHVISNGVSPLFVHKNVDKPAALKERYIILMVGRYSREKRQDLIIEAVKKSRYESQIQLILTGQGPWKGSLERLSRGLTNPVIFGFHDQAQLLDIINYSDLYVHASDAEIEAISCMEAFSCGLVPVISNSRITATAQFALSDMNLFEAGNSDSLRDRIEYWVDHPDLKKEFAQKYIEYSRQYQLDKCVTELEEVFAREIEEFKNTRRK